MSTDADFIGKKFGRLTVLREVDELDVYGKPKLECKCDCGNVVRTSRTYLRNGHKKSCGCFQIENRQTYIDITGKRIGRLTVLRRDPDTIGKGTGLKWICKCDCGNVVSVLSSNLVYKPSVGKANTLSCGCLLKEMRHEARFKDITGQRFGRLVALHVYTGEDNRKNKTTRWVCQCDCGNTAIVGTANLINGHSRSCGCLIEERRTTHGIGKTSVGKHLSGIHTAMQARCYNPTANGYANYGGRGIYICDEWYQPGVEGNPGLVNFYNWSIENGYEIGLTIDRIDNDGPYAPWNCRWVTYIDQMNNTSANKHIIDIDGERLTFAQFDRKHGLPSNYTSHYARYHTLNEIVYMVHHPELKLRQKKGKFIDQYGFTHLVPNYQNQNRRTIPHGKQKDRRA